jgi:hypothetical protein
MAKVPILAEVKRQMREAPLPAPTFEVTDVVMAGAAVRLRLVSGIVLEIPLALIPEVDPHNPAIGQVRVRGSALEWPDLDVYLDLVGLVVDALGVEILRRDIARRNAKVTSDARSAASAANGKLGGRPKQAATAGKPKPAPAKVFAAKVGPASPKPKGTGKLKSGK